MAKKGIVTEARILGVNKEEGRYDCEVQGRFDGGEWERIFSYYPDELSFSHFEFVGKTAEECEEIRHKKDVAYLQS